MQETNSLLLNIVGIDLAGVEKRASGIAVLHRNLVRTKILYTDKEIISYTLKAKPSLISIDAPLGLPKGTEIIRSAERELMKMGIRIFSFALKGMQKLALRGIKLRKEFEKRGYRVIETYPGAVQDILRIPRKGRAEVINYKQHSQIMLK